MYTGYKLNEINFGSEYNFYYKTGLVQYKNQKNEVKNNLELFLKKDKSLDGKKIIDSWFPEIKADIFLSHSHNDRETVIALTGWLNHHFNLTVFIDSCVWGCDNDLCKILDNKYSQSKVQKGNYDYEKVILSSSHVHMMLSSALASMIDKTECVIFYETPRTSKKFEETEETESPWIYSELLFTEIVRQTVPTRLKRRIKIFANEGFGALQGDPDALKINYQIQTKHLKKMDTDLLSNWLNYEYLKGNEALDKLYEITPKKIRI